MPDSLLPSQAEVDEHNLAHLPYRSWCKHCVRDGNKELPHHRVSDAIGNVMPDFHFDWTPPGEEEEGENLVVLVGRLRTLSTAVPWESSGELLERRVVAFLKEWS